jgi:hypothetical protein
VERLGQQHTYGIVDRPHWIDHKIGSGRQREAVNVLHDPLPPRWFQVGWNAVTVVVLAAGDLVKPISGVPRLNLTACGIVQFTSHNERIAICANVFDQIGKFLQVAALARLSSEEEPSVIVAVSGPRAV